MSESYIEQLQQRLRESEERERRLRETLQKARATFFHSSGPTRLFETEVAMIDAALLQPTENSNGTV